MGIVWLEREELDDTPLINSNFGGRTLLSADQLDFDHQPGLDASLSYRLSDGWFLDGRCL